MKQNERSPGFVCFALIVSALRLHGTPVRAHGRLEPSPALVDVLADFTTRAELALTITVFAHYEWPALATGTVAETGTIVL